MGKPKTYLCGGINNLNDADARDWRELAKELLATLTLDPMRRDYRGKEDENVKAIVLYDWQDIQESTYILVNATRPSWGTAMEIVYAYISKKFIVAFVGDTSHISPWLRFHVGHIVKTVEEACELINYVSIAGW